MITPPKITVLYKPHELTDSEQQQAQNFNELNILYLQNEKMKIVQQIVTLAYDSKDVAGYGVQLAYLQGQHDIIDYLLAAAAEASENTINTILREREEAAENSIKETPVITAAELFRTVTSSENNSF